MINTLIKPETERTHTSLSHRTGYSMSDDGKPHRKINRAFKRAERKYEMKKEIIMHDIIWAGIRNAPYLGMNSGFWPQMFKDTRSDWEHAKARVAEKGARFHNEAKNKTVEGHVVGEVVEKTIGNFVYLYVVNRIGQMEAQSFTHKVIAG